jgi:CheY-like chemotaxis protein
VAAEVLFVSDDASTMVQVSDDLEAAGLAVRWVPPREGDPARQKTVPDVVVLDTEATGMNAVEAARAWRAIDPAPALAVWGEGAAGQQLAAKLGLAFHPKRTAAAALGQALRRAAETRFVGALSRGSALHALGLAGTSDPLQDTVKVVAGARQVDLALVRDALRVYADSYVTVVGEIEPLRELRALTIPETNLLLSIDGARTLRRVVDSSVMDATGALRFLWALASMGVVVVTPEPKDDARWPAARIVARVRRRLAARRDVVARAKTFFDLLELPPDFERAPPLADAALRGMAVWYAPDGLAALDLGNLAPVVPEYWQQALKAHQTIADWATCKRYFFWLIERGIDLQPEMMARRHRDPEAAAAFQAGQAALAAGEAFRAVSQLAAAARLDPDEPDYEAYAGWARYLAEHARGTSGDTRAVLARETRVIEGMLVGRRPRGRALYVLGLMAQVMGDLDLARTSLNDALACEPTLAPAQRALARLTYGAGSAGR